MQELIIQRPVSMPHPGPLPTSKSLPECPDAADAHHTRALVSPTPPPVPLLLKRPTPPLLPSSLTLLHSFTHRLLAMLIAPIMQPPPVLNKSAPTKPVRLELLEHRVGEEEAQRARELARAV
eukprot:9489296-Pyramimonas_sp.AAC.1